LKELLNKDMKLIVGLGNPGIKYEKTRHNIGWRIIEELAHQIGIEQWKMEMKFNAFEAQNIINQEKIILIKPQTFMNDSGLSVRSTVNYYKIPVENILVIHDEIDLPLKEIRIQKERGSAGHKGVESIIEHLRTNNFNRMRIGIKSDKQKTIETEKFVLQNFTPEEEKIIQKIIKKAVVLITTALHDFENIKP